jgi:hypothetical protein
VFAHHRDWQAAFDVDGSATIATSKRLFDRAAADRMLVTGNHFPFPAAATSSKPLVPIEAFRGCKHPSFQMPSMFATLRSVRVPAPLGLPLRNSPS